MLNKFFRNSITTKLAIEQVAPYLVSSKN